MVSNIFSNLQSTVSGFTRIAEFYDKNKESSFNTISVSLTDWFDAHMAAPLGAVLDLIQDNLNNVVFETIKAEIQTILQKNSFLSYFGFDHRRDSYNTTIQYQKMKPDHGRYFREYVTAEFLSRSELPAMSKGLRKKMAETMMELFVNAQTHSETQHIYTCGQYFPKRQTMEFCIVDTGIGFKENFFRRFKKRVSSVDAIRWAIENHHTTKEGGAPGGIGLVVLKEFVMLNKGKLQIVSGSGYYQYDDNGEKPAELNKPFPGTVVNVTFNVSDNSNYFLTDEIHQSNLF